MNSERRLPAAVAATLAGAVLGALSAVAATARHGRPLHPQGRVFDAVLIRTGSPVRWGAPWLDEPGEDHGLARLSRAVGLPRRWPDVLGIALRFRAEDGLQHDLLLSTTGLGRISRFLMVPRRRPAAVGYSSLFPYLAPSGRVLIAAEPAGPLAFRMLAAPPLGAWRQFGRLELAARDSDQPDQPVRFDPVLHSLPGLTLTPSAARLREPAYAAARRFGRIGRRP
jgi:hypothetical protein